MAIEVMQGSKLPGDLSQKGLNKLLFRVFDDGHEMKVPFSLIDPHAFSESRLPSKLAVEPKRLIGLPGQQSHGVFVCTRNASGLAELRLEIGDETMDLAEEIQDWLYIDESLAIHGGASVSAVATGIVSLITDNIPVWAEASAVLALAATIPRKRVRLLFEFKTDRDPMVVETAEVVAILLDQICRGGGRDEDEERTGDAKSKSNGEDVYVMF